jgi:hypothetical protein
MSERSALGVDSHIRVQCQRTRRYLGPGCRRAGGVWECRFCPDSETYRQVELFDLELCALVERAIGSARAHFEKPDDGVQTRIWLGESPETIFEGEQGAVHLYLGRGSSWLQHAYSGAHEAFHRACSPCRGGHWADEMLAVTFSLLFLREAGLNDHADLNENALRDEASRCTLSQALSYRGGDMDGIYGRCFLIGETLCDAIGWEAMAAIPSYCQLGGQPGFDPWLAGLDGEAKAKACTALGLV